MRRASMQCRDSHDQPWYSSRIKENDPDLAITYLVCEIASSYRPRYRALERLG